jgi:DNA-binding LacI/PurR family transcriptional regulator
MAIAAIGALQRNGYDVPADISVVGHDDLPFGQWVHPRLTTISQDLQQMARVSALRLLQLLGAGTSKLTTIGSRQLIIRDSTAPPRRADERPVA